MKVGSKLGIVAGSGLLPVYLVEACRAAGREYFVLAIEGHAEAALFTEPPGAWIRLGEAGRGIQRLRAEQVEELVFAGAVRRPSLRELRPDRWTARLFARLGRAWIGDNVLLSAVIENVEQEGFRVIAPDSLLDGLLAREGVLGSISPDADAMADIERGIEVARALGDLDVGQAVIVQLGIVLGVEGAEGTNGLIERSAVLHRDGPGAVLVKLPKPGQERRIDLPVIGLETVTAAAAAGLRGIAVEAGGAMVLDQNELVATTDAAGLFIIGVKVAP